MDKSSDNEKAAKDLHVQRPWLKRSSSVLRDCDAGEAFSDGRMVKKMKEADYEGAQHLTNDKQTTDYEDKKCPRREPIRRSDGIIVKKQNYCGTTHANSSEYKRRKVISPRKTTSNPQTAHLGKRCSDVLLKLLPSSSLPLEDEEVVRDGPENKPENYQCEKERIKTFSAWPLNRIIHSKELAHVGFIYTGEGALVQCFQCGFMHGDWREGDVPLGIHQSGSPDCPFLQTLTSGSNSSTPREAAPQSSTQSQSTDSSTGQFPSRSDQVTRTRLRPFMQHRGSPELPRRQAQDWEAVCEITACQRTFSGQKRCLSGHTDICMDKMSGQSFGNLKIKSYWKLITTYVITRILTLCPGNSIYVHAKFIMP